MSEFLRFVQEHFGDAAALVAFYSGEFVKEFQHWFVFLT